MIPRVICCIVVAASTAAAQEDSAALQRQRSSKQQITGYLKRQARVVTDRAVQSIQTTESWDQQRRQRTEEMRDMMGLLPWPARTPLNLRKTGTVDGGDYTIEKIAFESLPKVYVTANLYVPKTRSGPLPGVVYVCGHAFSDYGAKTVYQHHGISLARNGYVAFILDPIQIAETYALHHGVWNQEFYDWYSRGYTPAGVEVWNAIRAIDYLETRPEVDRTRIGMTGRSGGAAMTLFTASVEPRVKAAVAAMGFNTYAATVGEANGMHCDCMFPINTHLHDLMTPSALIAPRPLLLTHGRLDPSFPIPGYQEAEQKIGALFAAYGKPESFRNLVVETGHADSAFQREQAILWFDRFLKGRTDSKVRLEYTGHPGEQLAVFSSNVPADAQNYRVPEILTPAAAPPRYVTLAAWEARRKQLLPLLRSRVFPALPKDSPAPTPLKPGENEFESEQGISVRYHLEIPRDAEDKIPAVLYIASDGEDIQSIRQFFAAARTRTKTAKLIVYPRGVGEVPWEKSFWKEVLRNAMHIGHTVDSMRLHDVMRAIDSLSGHTQVDASRITVTGRGHAGVVGLYAAILNERVQQIMLIQPPDTHADGPVFLNILRYTDLPEAAAMLAPRRLNFYGPVPRAFEYTRHVYGLYGKAGHLFRTASLEAVIDGRYHHGFSSGY